MSLPKTGPAGGVFMGISAGIKEKKVKLSKVVSAEYARWEAKLWTALPRALNINDLHCLVELGGGQSTKSWLLSYNYKDV